MVYCSGQAHIKTSDSPPPFDELVATPCQGEQTPEGNKRLVSSLNTLLIEKYARLDSSIVRLANDIRAPELPTPHLSEKDAQAAQQEYCEHHKKAQEPTLGAHHAALSATPFSAVRPGLVRGLLATDPPAF